MSYEIKDYSLEWGAVIEHKGGKMEINRTVIKVKGWEKKRA